MPTLSLKPRVKMTAPLESEVKEFLKTVANTVLKLDILSYYHDHPFAMDNAEGLARWLNRRTADVVAGLEEPLPPRTFQP